MKKYLVVRLGYEYNDQTYDVHDSYTAEVLCSTKERADQVALQRNKQELSRWNHIESCLSFLTEEQENDLIQHVKAHYPDHVYMTRDRWGKRQIVEWDKLPITIFEKSGIYPQFFTVIEVEEQE